MKTRIVRMGRSHVIRIPRRLLQQTGLTDEVEISVDGDSPLIRPVRRAQAGWDPAFPQMANFGDDNLLDDNCAGLSTWDQTEWEW